MGRLQHWPKITGNVFEIGTPFGCLLNEVVLENYWLLCLHSKSSKDHCFVFLWMIRFRSQYTHLPIPVLCVVISHYCRGFRVVGVSGVRGAYQVKAFMTESIMTPMR